MATRFLHQSVDYLGFISAKLRDLHGFSALINELIQNADDAPGVTTLGFEFRNDALIVENDGEFAEKDFNNVQNIASGAKRNEENTIGAFGFGFISVYQITDRPEICSAGRRWVIDPLAPEAKRIEETAIDNDGCTRFILPWAMDSQSEVRLKLMIEHVTQEKISEFQNELTDIIASKIMFLNKLERLEIRSKDLVLKRVDRISVDDGLIVDDGQKKTWKLLKSNFSEQAKILREQFGSNIEDKRKDHVTIAIPDQIEGAAGLFYSYVPTFHETRLPFHINADFFPESSRKRILLDDDYQGKWNKAAIRSAASLIAKSLVDLTMLLGHEDFWHLLSCIEKVHCDVAENDKESVLRDFWEKAIEITPNAEIIYSSKGDWLPPSDVFLLEKEVEYDYIEILERIGLHIVHRDLRSYHGLMRNKSIYVQILGAEDVADALTNIGLNQPLEFADAFAWLQPKKSYEKLGKEIGLLRERSGIGSEQKERADQKLAACTIALARDNWLRAPKDLMRASEEVIQIFMPLDSEHLFASPATPPEILELVPEFNLEHALGLIEASISDFTHLWEQNDELAVNIIDWIADYCSKTEIEEETKQKLFSLKIWPAGNQLSRLDEIVIPGKFDDPLGITSILDKRITQKHRHTLIRLGVKELDITTYVTSQIPRYFSQNENISNELNRGLIELLAREIGEFRDNITARRALENCLTVECEDGELRKPSKVYLRTEEFRVIQGFTVHFAKTPSTHREAILEFLKWLGVASCPRVEHILQIILDISKKPATDSNRYHIQNLFAYLGSRFKKDGSELLEPLQPLRNQKWLPAEGKQDRWYAPEELYAVYRRYLFESQANFLEIPIQIQNECRDFIDYLEIEFEPTCRKVVSHLISSAKAGKEVNREVYTFLNINKDDPAIAQLRVSHCLLMTNGKYVRPDRVYWNEHRFGKYRFRIGTEWRKYNELLDKLGVKEHPDFKDAKKVIIEISEEFGSKNKKLDDETKEILLYCWQLLNAAKEDDLNELKNKKVIPDYQGMLKPPQWMYIEDRIGLASKFPEILSQNLIPKFQHAWEAMQKAGVRLLSKAITTHLAECINPNAEQAVSKCMQERKMLLKRVIETHRDDASAEWNIDHIDEIKFKIAEKLMVQFTLDAFKRSSESEPEEASIFFEEESSILYYQQQTNRIPWAAISRELAYFINPNLEAGRLSSGIKEVLAADTFEEASTALDELGYAPLVEIEMPEAAKEEHGIGGGEHVDDEKLKETGKAVADTQAEAADEVLDSPVEQVEQNAQKADEQHDGKVEKYNLPEADTDAQEISSASEAVESILGHGIQRPEQMPAELDEKTSYDFRGNGSHAKRPKSGRKDTQPKHKPYTRLRSYVSHGLFAKPEKRDDNEDKNVDAIGINRVLDFENDAGRTPVEMPHNHPGYDIESKNGKGEVERYIEVKSRSDRWDRLGIELNKKQFETAREMQDKFWLYIVEYAEDDEKYCMHRIQNPAAKIDKYCFDDGWRVVAEMDVHKEKEREINAQN